MPRSSQGALLCAPLLCACLGSEPKTPGPFPGPARTEAPGTPPDELRAEAQRCLEAGQLERARDLLDQLLLGDILTRARAELAAGSPEDALTTLDRGLDLAPGDEQVRLLKADASLRLAEVKIQEGGGSAGLIEGVLTDALDFFRSTTESAHSLLGASRAAWLLGDPGTGLDLARRAQALRDPREPTVDGLGVPAERIYAEQVWFAYSAALRAQSEEASALFAECENALGMLLGRESDDPWAWSRLSDLYEGEEHLTQARNVCERGLKRSPADAGLLERLARLSRKTEGSAATVKALEAYVGTHPEVSAARWELAVARFQLALGGPEHDPTECDPRPLTVAENDFRDLRVQAPEFTQQALGYEVVCRLARGWCAFRASDLERATSEFLSMNELFGRGVEWSLPGELESGIQGLFLVADAHAARDEPLRAAETFERLHELQPDSAQWANNAGFLLREVAFALENEGKSLSRAGRKRLTNPEALRELRASAGIDSPTGSSQEREDFARAAEQRFSRAREIMERSWRAYRAAAALAPEDIRVVNDAALVLVYYLHHELDWAEAALLRCVELGPPQIAAKQAELASAEEPERASALESELALLTEAWGDAHQNLGVLEWIHRKNAAAARAWLEKAIEIWPARPPVTNSLLPQIRGELEPEEDDHWDLLNWAQPCRP